MNDNGLIVHTTLPINNITAGINLPSDIQDTYCTNQGYMWVPINVTWQSYLWLAQSLSLKIR